VSGLVKHPVAEEAESRASPKCDAEAVRPSLLTRDWPDENGRCEIHRREPKRPQLSFVLLFLKGIAIDVTPPVAQFLASQSHEFDLMSRRILMSKRERDFRNSQDIQDAIVLL